MKWRKVKSSQPEEVQSPRMAPSHSSLYVRLLWMASIWAASVLVLLAIAGILRLVLNR